MVLSTHIVIGAAAAQFWPQNPALAFGVALISHYASDALIPHWDYHPSFIVENSEARLKNNIVINRQTLVGVGQVILDLLIGVLVAYLAFFQSSFNFWLFGSVVLGSILPDVLQAFYFWLKWPSLCYLQIFHDWVHHPAKYKITNPWWGIGSQMLVAMIAIALAKLL